jgi:hypothetical protein
MLHAYVRLLVALPEGQAGEGWDHPKSSDLSEIGECWIEKVLSSPHPPLVFNLLKPSGNFTYDQV